MIAEEKRIYWMDAEVLRLVSLDHFYAREIAMITHRSKRCVNKHVAKLVRWGWIRRVGSTFCPFQWNDHDYGLEISRARILQDILKLWTREPGRSYFIIPFASATVPASYHLREMRSPGRPGGRSVPYGVHLPVASRDLHDSVFVMPLGDLGEDSGDSLLQDLFDDFSVFDLPFTFPDEFDEREEPFGDEDEFQD